MDPDAGRSVAARSIGKFWATAAGREHRHDPVLQPSGGPAGNARLTAWTGIVLLPLFLAEVATLLSLHQLISWHIVLGTVLVPPALLKTASTGWRIARYYTGHRAYVEAGPPPLLFRLLGPLVVITTLALLGTGLALVALGHDSAHTRLFAAGGLQVSALTLHQLSFILWAGATGLHLLGRTMSALRLAAPSPHGFVPGGIGRMLTLTATMATAAVTAWLVLVAAGAWAGA
ncbi:MAG TPA: hypothetical protein VH279_11895 [Solirubrobacteraceae bacterium]|jgi:hypothetical protein|nr:hypothetical protein [Solirubrobacteraceae bacterium]